MSFDGKNDKKPYLGKLTKAELDEFFKFDAEPSNEKDITLRLQSLSEQIKQITKRLERVAQLLPGNKHSNF